MAAAVAKRADEAGGDRAVNPVANNSLPWEVDLADDAGSGYEIAVFDPEHLGNRAAPASRPIGSEIRFMGADPGLSDANASGPGPH